MATGKLVGKRIELQFFDGVNSIAAWNMSKKQELAHSENVTSPEIGILERRKGYETLGDDISATSNLGLFYFPSTNASSLGLYRISTVPGNTNIYYLNTSNVWTVLVGADASFTTTNKFSTTTAEGRMYLVNGDLDNRFIAEDGTTVLAAAGSYLTNDLFNAPKARKINYYKGRLYVADCTYGSVNYKNQVQVSSPLVGILALVDGDHAVGSTTIALTETKYVYSTDSLEVFRGDTYITTLTVNGKTETSITLSGTASPNVELLSGDEVWVAGTNKNKTGNTGLRRFRWSTNPGGGMPYKLYDTFQLVGGDNDRIRMLTNVGGYQLIGNTSVLASWDGANLVANDTGVGSVSDTGFVKFLGVLYFVSYTGIYATRGSISPRLMSSPVDKYIQGATKAGLESAVAGRKGLSLFFHIGTVTLYNPDGTTFRTLSDVVLEYDARQDNWYPHTGIPVELFATFVSSSDADSLVFAENAGDYNVYTAFSGETDNGVTIPMRVDLHPMQLCDNFEDFAYPKTISIHMARGNSMQCFVTTDEDDKFYELQGQFDKGVGVMTVTSRNSERVAPVKCHRLRISLRGNTVARPRVSKIAVNYSQTEETEQPLR